MVLQICLAQDVQRHHDPQHLALRPQGDHLFLQPQPISILQPLHLLLKYHHTLVLTGGQPRLDQLWLPQVQELALHGLHLAPLSLSQLGSIHSVVRVTVQDKNQDHPLVQRK